MHVGHVTRNVDKRAGFVNGTMVKVRHYHDNILLVSLGQASFAIPRRWEYVGDRQSCFFLVVRGSTFTITRMQEAQLRHVTFFHLCRPRRGGHVPKKEFEQRLAMFNSGNWQELVSHSVHMSASQNLVRRGRFHNSDTLEARALQVKRFAGRQAFESARVAPGTVATL